MTKILLLLTILFFLGDVGIVLLPDIGDSVDDLGVKKLAKLQFGDFVMESEFSPDGRYFVSNKGRGGELRVWTAKTWDVVRNLDHPDTPRIPLFAPDSQTLVTTVPLPAKGGMYNDQVWFWNIESGKRLSVFERGNVKAPVNTMTFSPDGKMMAWGMGDGNVQLVDVGDLNKVRVVKDRMGAFFDSIRSVSFSPDGRYLAIASISWTLSVIEVETGKEVFRNKEMVHTYQVKFTPDGTKLAVAGKLGKGDSWTYTIRFFKTGTWEMTDDLRKRDGDQGLFFSSKGDALIAVSESGFEIVDLARKKVLKSFKNNEWISAAAYSAVDKSIAIGDMKGNIDIYSAPKIGH